MHENDPSLVGVVKLPTCHSSICVIVPVPCLDMGMCGRHALPTGTDPYGVQWEALFSRVLCVILRGETE